MMMMIDEDDDDDWWPWHLGGHSPPSLRPVSPRWWHCHGNRRFLSSPSLHGYRPALIHKRCRGNAAPAHWWNLGIAAATGMGSGSPSDWFFNPFKPPLPLTHPPTHTWPRYPHLPSSNSSLCSSCVLCKRTVCAHKHNFPADTHRHTQTHTLTKQVQVHPLPQKQIHTLRRIWWQWRMQRGAGSMDDPLSLLLLESERWNSGVFLTYSHMHTQIYRVWFYTGTILNHLTWLWLVKAF